MRRASSLPPPTISPALSKKESSSSSSMLDAWRSPPASGPLARLEWVRIEDGAVAVRDRALALDWGIKGLAAELSRRARRDDRPRRLVRGRQRRDPGRGLVRRRLRARAPSPRARARARRCRARADRAAAFGAGVARAARSRAWPPTRGSLSTRASWWPTRSRSVSRESARTGSLAVVRGEVRGDAARSDEDSLGRGLDRGLRPLAARPALRPALRAPGRRAAGARAQRGLRLRGEPASAAPCTRRCAPRPTRLPSRL